MNRSSSLFVLVLATATAASVGCSSRPPCEEPVDGPPGDIAQIGSHVEPANVKLVHFVDFTMGPIHETLEGYMIVRAPDALRLYGMSETGQKAFDVAVLRGKVARIYRAPFLKDDRILDIIIDAAQKIFLLRSQWNRGASINVAARPPCTQTNEGFVLEENGVRFCWAGPQLHLRWLEGDKFSACFMDWSSENGVYAPRRIHFHSEEGRYPYDLRMKLVDSKLLAAPPADSVFEAR